MQFVYGVVAALFLGCDGLALVRDEAPSAASEENQNPDEKANAERAHAEEDDQKESADKAEPRKNAGARDDIARLARASC